MKLVFWPENYLRNLRSFVSCELHVGRAQPVQVEVQPVQVEQEHHHEEKRESKTMDAKILAPNFNVNPRLSDQVFSEAIDDEKRSVASGQSAKTLSSELCFESATAK